MRSRMYDGRWMMWLCALLITYHFSLLTSCKSEDDKEVIVPARHWVEKTVAVVAPLGEANMKTRLERTAEWFLENLNHSQRYDTLAVTLKLEWYDEQSQDLEALSTTLASRDDIAAVIGPFGNEALSTFAPACQKTLKPLIAPTATSEDVIRRYAIKNNSGITNDKPFLWALTKPDVALSETMMSAYAVNSQFYGYQKPSANVFSPNNLYGKTFNYWAPFFAEDYGISMLTNGQYTGSDQLVDAVLKARESTRGASIDEATFCVVENVRQMYDVTRRLRETICTEESYLNDDPDAPANDKYWLFINLDYQLYFALNDLSEESLTALGDRGRRTLQGYEGFSPYADPTTGFEKSYKERYGVLPTFSECKFYDALLLTAFAASYAEHQPSTFLTLNDAIAAIGSRDNTDYCGAAWNVATMEVYLRNLEQGRLMHFKGASGDIAFDDEGYTLATHTTYVHWRILEGEIQHIGYLGDTGSQRLSDNYSAWEYLYDRNRAEQDFDEQTAGGKDFPYAPLTSQYAVLVQGSNGFDNYRHLSDVLLVYQLLRANGYDDDHIILVLDRSIPTDAKNNEPGIIRASNDGKDLYGGHDGLPAAVVDYDNGDLTPTDITHILTGRQSDRTPAVVPPDAGHNVFLYWSGHGHSGEFTWRNNSPGKGFTSQMLKTTAQTMLTGDSPTSRKFFVVAEPCYGEGVITALNGITGALGISGANNSEQSWADNWSNTMLVWLSDRFTQNFVTSLSANPTASYHDLFIYCAVHTLGSHARIVNAPYFGNLNTTSPAEFITYQ